MLETLSRCGSGTSRGSHLFCRIRILNHSSNPDAIPDPTCLTFKKLFHFFIFISKVVQFVVDYIIISPEKQNNALKVLLQSYYVICMYTVKINYLLVLGQDPYLSPSPKFDRHRNRKSGHDPDPNT